MLGVSIFYVKLNFICENKNINNDGKNRNERKGMREKDGWRNE